MANGVSVQMLALRKLRVAVLQVKEYLERQWGKILANRVSVQDFVFAKEVRLGTYSPKAAVVPPAAIVAAKAMATDPRAEPRFAERVPYVVVYGEPGQHRPCSQHDAWSSYCAYDACGHPLPCEVQVLLAYSCWCCITCRKHAKQFKFVVMMCKLCLAAKLLG